MSLSLTCVFSRRSDENEFSAVADNVIRTNTFHIGAARDGAAGVGAPQDEN